MPLSKSFAQTTRQRAPVIIVGAHRSGTTATARALELCGLQIGQRLDSHHEPKALQRLHENYLQCVGASWHHPKPFLDRVQTPDGERDCVAYLREWVGREFARLFGYRKNPRGLWLLVRLKFGAIWGWKEPRTTLFAPVWLQLFPGAHIIHVIRHPLAVAMSIRQREMKFRTAGDPPTPQLDGLDYCLRLALAYIETAEHVAERTPYYRRIRFEDLQRNPTATLEELAAFCGFHPSRRRLTKSAGTIRAQNSPPSNGMPEYEVRELLSRYPMIAKLGYGWNDIQR
jgi:Sulfotransferase family